MRALGTIGICLLFFGITVTPALSGPLYYYDKLNRVKTITYPDCSMDAFSHNASGQKTSSQKIAKADLLSVDISGPLEIEENSRASYTVVATFRGGAVLPVSGGEWSVNASMATFDKWENGLLKVGNVGDQTISISVSYGGCSAVQTDTAMVLVKKSSSPAP